MASKRIHYVFINPDVLRQIDERTSAICSAHNVPADNRWQVWQMAATIILGKATEVSFSGTGIAAPGWDLGNDPMTAWGGFYRMDRGQWYGHSAYTVWVVMTQGNYGDNTRPDVQLEHCRRVYSLYDMVWEDAPMQDGYYWYHDVPTHSAALTYATLQAATAPGYRAHTIVPRRYDEGYRVFVYATRRAPGVDNCSATRVPTFAPQPVRLQARATRRAVGAPMAA